MKIVEFFAVNWLRKKANISDEQEKLVRSFAKEIEKLMGIEEEANEKS